MANKVQSVIFEASEWTVEKARDWLDEHDFRSDKVDTTEDDDGAPVAHRFRQFDPDMCAADSFETLTDDLPAGVSMVSCDADEESAAAGLDRLETRTFPMELRVAGTDDAPILEGHIAVFNQLSENLFDFREKIEPGAFAETIKRDDIMALWNHQNDLVLGRTSAETLALEEDDVGLAFTNTPPDTTWFRDRMVSLKRKDVTGASFGFMTERDEWTIDPDDPKMRIRTLKKLRLFEVSPGVTFPAYPQTDVALRSMRRWEWETAKARVACKPGQPARNLVDIARRKRRLRLHELAQQ